MASKGRLLQNVPAAAIQGEMRSCFLFSVDFEDNRVQTDNGSRHPNRVPQMASRLLRFLDDHRLKVTFFVVGDVADQNPGVVREIISAGHEVGCHTRGHTVLDSMTPGQFRESMMNNLESLTRLGAEEVIGFRSPQFSLVESTKWAWDVLRELGFRYSSSVLPARNPLYGWDGFPLTATKLPNGLWELPVSVTHTPLLKVPFAGGMYLRALPTALIRYFSDWYAARSWPLAGYIHLHDFDAEQTRFQVEKNPLFNWLIYYNRNSVFPKLDMLFSRLKVSTYSNYVRYLEENPSKQIPSSMHF